MPKIHLTTFAKNRHTPTSPRSHFGGTEEELIKLVQDNFAKAKPGYRAGVILVPVPPENFFSAVIELHEGDSFSGKFVPRRAGEEPRKEIYVTNRSKSPAKIVNIVLYRHDVLKENNEQESNAEWEIVSINAAITEEEEPIAVMTLLHNHFESNGGTKTNLSDSDFVAMLKKSFVYWKNKSQIMPI